MPAPVPASMARRNMLPNIGAAPSAHHASDDRSSDKCDGDAGKRRFLHLLAQGLRTLRWQVAEVVRLGTGSRTRVLQQVRKLSFRAEMSSRMVS